MAQTTIEQFATELKMPPGALLEQLAAAGMAGKGIDITLAYATGSDEWVALDSRLDGGRTLRYRRSAGELELPSVVRQARADAPASGR